MIAESPNPNPYENMAMSLSTLRECLVTSAQAQKGRQRAQDLKKQEAFMLMLSGPSQLAVTASFPPVPGLIK